MPRPRTVSDEQILSTMRSCVMDHGPHVPLDLVAEKLGVTGPALLKRFGSRQALMVKALIPAEPPGWISDLSGGPDTSPFDHQFEDLLVRLSDFLADLVPCMSALRQSGVPTEAFADTCPAHVPVVDAVAQWLVTARNQGIVDGTEEELHTAANAMLGAVQFNLVMSHLFKRAWSKRSQRDYVRHLSKLFVRALVRV